MPIKFVGEPFCVSKEFWYREVSSKGGGKLHGFVEIFFISQDRRNFRGTILCFRKFLVGKIILWIRGGGGGITIFRRSFCLTVPKTFVRESYCFWENFWFQKALWMKKRGGITFFRRNFLVWQCRKISWASLQCFRNFGVSKKFMHNRGYHNFPPTIFSLTVPTNFV